MNEKRVPKFSIDDIRAVAEEFELLLRSKGTSVTPSRSLERMTLSVYDAQYQRQLRIPPRTARSEHRGVAGDRQLILGGRKWMKSYSLDWV